MPFLVLGCLGCMLVPLPTSVLDALLAANLCISILLLFTSISITSTLEFSSLPTLLLFTTLARLSLNVATTRSILTIGEAGDVVYTFGELVMAGSITVGFVIFAIITLLQFLVIAKGAERVAEVSARFTLDALPGKQMAIDADVRAGTLDYDGAKKKREELQLESRFFGALDGAMKFIKGDAIAGVLIVIINLIGGIVAGLINGKSVSEAIKIYSLLSIGDGLLSQVPSLLTCLAAAIVVTRIDKKTFGEGSLGNTLIKELCSKKIALIIVGCFSIVLGVFGGFPALPFCTIGVAVILMSFMKLDLTVEKEITPKSDLYKPTQIYELELRLNDEFIKSTTEDKVINLREGLRKKLHQHTGLLLQSIGVTKNSEDKSNLKNITIIIHGVECHSINATVEENLIDNLSEAIIPMIEDLITDGVIKNFIEQAEPACGDSLGAIIPSQITVSQISELIRNLIREDIMPKYPALIMQAICDISGKGIGERGMLEEVRIKLKRVITSNLKLDNKVSVYRLSGELDMAFAHTERTGEALSDDVILALIYGVQNLDNPIVIQSSKGSRKLVQECLYMKGIQSKVVAYEEITCETEILGVISSAVNKAEELRYAA